MIIQVLLLVTLIIASIKSIFYLCAYLKLVRAGAKTEGHVVTIESSKFIITKNAAIPHVNFVTSDNKVVINKPIYSWFVELNNYIPGKYCIAYYNKKQINVFVVKSNGELTANFVIIGVTVIAITWFILTRLWQ